MEKHNRMLRKTLFTAKEEEKATREGFGEGLVIAGKKNGNIVALCADLTDSTKMDLFKKEFPLRYFEMGITEQAMAGIASGMAAMGRNPFIASYAMFSPGRNWEQIRTMIAYNDQPVKVVGAHAGISVGPDGATHQALEDIAIMRAMPNMNILVPCDSVEAKAMTEFLGEFEHPAYLRLTREKTPILLEDDTPFAFGKASILFIPKNKFGKPYLHRTAIIGCGPVLYEALKATIELEKEGIGATVINMSTIKPLDTDFLLRLSKDVHSFVTVEEAQVHGGLGGAVSEYMSAHKPIKIVSVGVEDRFGQSGKPKELYEEYGLTANHIMEAVKRSLA